MSFQISSLCKRGAALVLMLGLAAATPQLQAQSFRVFHNFTGSDGAYPANGLTGQGKLFFGTASSGGKFNNGVVFRINANGVQTVLHHFAGGADGAGPQGTLVSDQAGNFYGTTAAGGTSGVGTVFAVKGKKESVLYSFHGGTDGASPQAGLVQDAAGNLYGTTSLGGPSGKGTVFELVAPQIQGGPWTERVLYSFGTGTDGATPIGGVNFDSAGNLYGTTSEGGAYGLGTVFQLVAGSKWTENILHSFANQADGSVPYAGLISDKSGNFYGAASQGGQGGDNGGGTIFKLSPSNGNWTFTVIYRLPGWGISGDFRNLVLDGSGHLFGTTHCDGDYSAGTVYQLTSSGGSWTYKQLYTFTGGTDGDFSVSNLVLNQGKLYGTTLYGGAYSSGVVYEVTP